MWKLFFGWLFLTSCTSSTLPQVDARQEYTNAVARLNLNPVYPPRQSVRVGDVYFVLKAKSRNPEDLVYLGHLAGFERFAANYDSGALPIYLSRATTDVAGKVSPFSGRGSVMPVAFPAISVSAASATALGSTLPGGAGFLNFGRARTVSIGFENTREFGLPKGIMPDSSVYQSALQNMVTRYNETADSKIDCDIDTGISSVQNARDNVVIVRRVYITNLIRFTSANARATRTSAAAAAPPAAQVTAPAAVNLSITLPENASAAQVEAVMNAASTTASSGSPIGIGTFSSSGAIVSYSQPIGGYVVFAYDPVTISPRC